MANGSMVGVLSEEQQELRRVVRGFLAKYSSEADVRESMATAAGYRVELWQELASGLGVAGLAIPEEYGGAGFGYAELGIVFEEAGRALLCAPYFASVALAAEVLLRAGDDAAAKDLLPAIAAGHRTATLALTEQDGRWDGAALATTARRTDGGWLLRGVKTYVPDGHTAELLLVVADTDAGTGLFAIDTAAGPVRGLRRSLLPTIDQTRKLGRIEFDDVPARLVGAAGTAWPAVERALATAAVLLAAEQLGGAGKVMELAVDYAKVREQYGRPIGSFQAVKHRLADMLVDVECARSAVVEGLRALDENAPDVAEAAAVAKAFCSEIYTRVSAGAIQVHGGIGFTWEHPAHLYFKRAKSSELLLGTPSYHRGRLARRLGL